MKIKNFVQFAFFVAIECILFMTPLGFIPLGVVRATTLHIPVIICAIVMGKNCGMGLGFVFGLLSLITNTITPTITSFVFSPFLSGHLASLIVVFLPRILLGYVSYWVYTQLEKIAHLNKVSVAISAALATFCHTVLVLGFIYLFFGQSYATIKEISYQSLWNVFMGIVFTNGVMEMIVAAILCSAIVVGLKGVKR